MLVLVLVLVLVLLMGAPPCSGGQQSIPTATKRGVAQQVSTNL
jgi:hypothetical protein